MLIVMVILYGLLMLRYKILKELLIDKVAKDLEIYYE